VVVSGEGGGWWSDACGSGVRCGEFECVEWGRW